MIDPTLYNGAFADELSGMLLEFASPGDDPDVVEGVTLGFVCGFAMGQIYAENGEEAARTLFKDQMASYKESVS